MISYATQSTNNNNNNKRWARLHQYKKLVTNKSQESEKNIHRMEDNVCKSYVINNLFEEYIKKYLNNKKTSNPSFKKLAKDLNE